MEKTMDSTSAKIHAASSVIVATIVAIGVIIAAVILAGGNYGRGQGQCATVNGGGPAKAMESSMVMNVMIRDGNREIGMQEARYDYDANTILVKTANTTGSTSATVAIDYDRSVVFIEVHGQSLCLASALHGDMMSMADRFTSFMMDETQQEIDRATAKIVRLNYARIGMIPAGYVANSNGPTIRGLCAGDESQWTEQSFAGGGRKRRQISGSIDICIFGFCFNISF